MAEPLAGALLALWNDVDAELDAPYNDWHANEHVPERLTVPGIVWARRYRRPTGMLSMPGYLTLYGLRDAAVLDSEPYQRLLREPTPWSLKMRPALCNLSRWVCEIHDCADLDAGSRLAVWTLGDQRADGQPDIARLLSIPHLGHLVAKRQPQSRPLPWLQANQAHAIEGRWIVCLAIDHDPEADQPVPINANVYRRLPVGCIR